MSMLEGIKVIDLTRQLAGPFATMTLSDLGAEVIKVEMPGKGDDARYYNPVVNGESYYFMSINRGKKGVTLNLKDRRGQDILRSLLATADVLVENFRPGVMENLGLSYSELEKINPQLIYACVTGFGHNGPYRYKPAYDMIVQGYGGIMSVTGQPDGPPTRVGISIGDIAAGMYLTNAILGALIARQRNGKGDFLDVAMLDCQMAIMEHHVARYQAGELPVPIGNRHASIMPFQSFPSKDGYVIVCAANQKQWEDYCRALNHPELINDSRFLDNGLRCKNYTVLNAILAEIMGQKTTTEWILILEKADVPVAPVLNVAQLVDNEQIKARDMVASFVHSRMGKVYAPSCPIKSQNYPHVAATPHPLLGEHNKEVYMGLGLSEQELEQLALSGVI